MTSIHQRPPYHNKFRIRRPLIERERDGVWLEHLGHCSHCDSWRSLGHIVSQVLGKMHRERMP